MEQQSEFLGELKAHITVVNYTRPLSLCKQVVILDGLTGTGKTMFSPLLSSFERMQNARFEYMFEYLCISAKQAKLSQDGADSLLNLLADVKYYDGTISREVNFRPGDLSSVLNGSKAIKYIKQLWMKDGHHVEERINKENPILFLVTHQLLSCIEPALEAFKHRLKLIEMVRHPLYLLDHWATYIEMHGNSTRDFTIWIESNGISIPWFAKGWEGKYIKSSTYDKVVYAIEYLMESVFLYAGNNALKKSIMFVPFEKFVLSPTGYLKDLELFLDTSITDATNSILKKQRVPRPSINAGPQRNIYIRYGLKKYDKAISHEQDYQIRLNSAFKKSSPEAFLVVQRLSKKYEEIFGTWF